MPSLNVTLFNSGTLPHCLVHASLLLLGKLTLLLLFHIYICSISPAHSVFATSWCPALNGCFFLHCAVTTIFRLRRSPNSVSNLLDFLFFFSLPHPWLPQRISNALSYTWNCIIHMLENAHWTTKMCSEWSPLWLDSFPWSITSS